MPRFPPPPPLAGFTLIGALLGTFHNSPSTLPCTAEKLLKLLFYLTIIPRARVGSESIAHEAKGRMGC